VKDRKRGGGGDNCVATEKWGQGRDGIERAVDPSILSLGRRKIHDSRGRWSMFARGVIMSNISEGKKSRKKYRGKKKRRTECDKTKHMAKE